jgi:hypothetical protein
MQGRALRWFSRALPCCARAERRAEAAGRAEGRRAAGRRAGCRSAPSKTRCWGRRGAGPGEGVDRVGVLHQRARSTAAS